MCMCIRTCGVHACACVCVCMHTCKCMSVVCARVHAYAKVCVHAWVMCMRTYVCVRVRISACVRVLSIRIITPTLGELFSGYVQIDEAHADQEYDDREGHYEGTDDHPSRRRHREGPQHAEGHVYLIPDRVVGI